MKELSGIRKSKKFVTVISFVTSMTFIIPVSFVTIMSTVQKSEKGWKL